MGIESRPIELVLNALVRTGLVLNFDPQLDDVAQEAVEISPSGRRHLSWGSGNIEYVSAMMATTPLLVEDTLDKLRTIPAARWKERTQVFLRYLLEEDRLYCSVPKHARYSSQSRLSDSLSRLDQHLGQTSHPAGRHV